MVICRTQRNVTYENKYDNFLSYILTAYNTIFPQFQMKSKFEF